VNFNGNYKDFIKMKTKITLLTLFLFFAATFFYSSFAQEIEKKPIAVLLEQSHKFDPVIEGLDVTHDFILQNKGNADLIIEKVKSG
jgi:hypothetical protein